jgi:hypothetical protein
VDDDVKLYVHERFKPNDVPNSVARSWASGVQNNKLLKILITELHMLRLAFCRHQPGFCGIRPCGPPEAVHPARPEGPDLG